MSTFEEDERAGRSRSTTIGGALDHWLTATGLGHLRAFQKVVERWPEVVGDDAACHVTPRAIEAQTLVVGVDHQTWATHLRFRQDSILKSLNSLVGAGALTSIRTRVEP